MKVILKQYVYKHGVAGDIVEVSQGFARNFLIPKGLAVQATPRALAENEKLLVEAALRRNELNEQLIKVAQQIDGVELVFGRKAGSNGKLYGSVTTTEIAEALHKASGIDINRRRISERPLREIGQFEVPVRMGQDLSPVLKIVIVREEELEAYFAKKRGEEEISIEDVMLDVFADVQEELGALLEASPAQNEGFNANETLVSQATGSLKIEDAAEA